MTLLSKLFRKFKRDDAITNLYHPQFEGQTELATNPKGDSLIVNGVKYYRFKKETSMPWGRYMFLQTFHKEQEIRLDLPLLKKYMDNITKALNPNKGVVEMTKIYQIVGQIQSRIELAFEKETTYRLASVLYFDDTEDLNTYDKAYNDKKIAAWKEAKCVDFFYMTPMTDFLNLSDSLPQDLQTFMDQQDEIIWDLTPETPEP